MKANPDNRRARRAIAVARRDPTDGKATVARWATLAALAAITLFLLGVASARADLGEYGSFGGFGHDFGHGWGGWRETMIFHWIIVFLVIGLIVFLVVAGIKWLFKVDSGEVPGQDGAASILKNRFARGEIDAAEYQDRMAELRK